MGFHGNIAVVTGGASGIGLEHVLQMAKQGSTVAVIDIEDSLKGFSSFSDKILPFRCDVTELSQVRNTIEEIEESIGAIDRLIHCAAIMPGGLLSDTPTEEIDRVMKVNYLGMVNTVQSVLPYLLKRDSGDLIVYGSVAGIVESRRFGAYGASKSATNFFMKVLMSENEGSGVRFLLVCPPAVDTPLINQAKNNGPEFLQDIQSTRKHLVSPDFVVKKVEESLEKGKKICYPGPAKWVQIFYPLFPGLIEKIVNSGNM
ncbi:SDR family NAD(P)-dependent oxidoreductase [Membranihabitans maritimus]|uniref:SDR family NAD(P)-dependent oxidoreductase n=1 Tax=Membranihabitans maritimus TaxID=2904244 RepID=UPI001F19C9D5|nr:SDR family oxidoreductase [Membranihabitans maritimus]